MQAAIVLSKTDLNPRIFTLHYNFLLPIIQQIVTMFLSVNDLGFAKANPELLEFVLNRNYLPPRCLFYMYFNRGGPTERLRYLIITAKLNITTSKITTLSEISHSPFDYVMTIDSDAQDVRLFEITLFSLNRYNEFKALEIRPVVLDTPTFAPGDYRPPEDIMLETARSIEEERRSGGAA